jgi:hypothetical protein
MEDINLDCWKKRWTVRRFKEDIPERSILNTIHELFKYIPVQSGLPNSIWMVLYPEDKNLKTWLSKNVYYKHDQEYNHTEYNAVLSEAPYVFHSFRLKPPEIDPRDFEFWRNNSFEAGVLVSECLRLNYDVTQISCITGFKTDGKLNEYQNYISLVALDKLKKLESSIEKDWILQPGISIGIGSGYPLESEMYEKYYDGVRVVGQTRKKIFNNFIL